MKTGAVHLLSLTLLHFNRRYSIAFLDYAIGHRHRGGAPLSYRRFNPHFEVFGWWQVMVNVIIGLYYAVVLGWAASYTYFSLNSAWGDQPY